MSDDGFSRRDLSRRLPAILDRVHARGRRRELEKREDEVYGHQKRERERQDEVRSLQHADQVEGIEEERGAREVARRLPRDGAEAPAGGEQPEQLGGPGMEEGGEGTEAAPAAQAPAQPPRQLWYRTAEAQKKFWEGRGRPDRASKVMVDAYKNAFTEEETRFQHEIQPQQHKIRELNLTAEEMNADATATQLKQAAELNQMHAAGKLWGLVKMGATQEAINLFNSSNVLQPGVKADSITVVKVKGEGDQTFDAMVMLDQEGKPIKNKKGQDMLFPVMLLDRMHEQSITSTATLKPGDSIVQIKKDPTTGATRITPVHTAPPTAAQQQGADRNRETLRQHGRQALKDRLFAGQTMMDKVDAHKQDIHGRAQPLVDQYVDQGMTPAAAADKAVKEAEEAIKREKAGAGKKQPGGARPTVRDIIGG